MKGYQRLDVQLALLFILILSATVTMTGWLHRGGQLIEIREPVAGMQAHLQAIKSTVTGLSPEGGDMYQHQLQQRLAQLDAQVHERDYLYLVMNEQFEILAHTASQQTYIELVRAEVAPGHFVITTSNILDRIDVILIDEMVPGLRFHPDNREPLWLLAIPDPVLVDRPTMQPILLDGLRNHLGIFGWYYGGVILLLILFIRFRLRPLRQLESVAQQLTRHQIPQPVTAPKRDDEVGQLVTAFNTAIAKLADNESQRQRMIADISHELRTPLTNISGRIEAYEDGIITDHQALIAFTSQHIRGLTAIVEDLSLLTQFDTGELTLHKHSLALTPWLTELFEAASLGESFSWQLTGDVPAISLDPGRFSQIINNLLNNAQKAKAQGLTICVRLSCQGDQVKILFEDNGPGVETVHLPRLFERLYRVDASRTSHTGGSGLGLSIVSGLVQAHDGQIQAYQVPTGGLGFEILLPLK